MNISVAMATYNGEQFIKEQLLSVLSQLDNYDEIVISDDNSTDNTTSIILSFIENDSRIRLINGPCKGVVKNFENAIKHCNNEYVLLCDQDDLWKSNKVSSLLYCFENESCDLVLHNAEILNENSTSDLTFFEKRGCRKGIFNNILKNSYIGCCMAFKREMIQFFTPFPDKIPMHDQWIGIICEKYGKVEFLNENLIVYRRHDNNISKDEHSSILQMLKWRIYLVANLIKRLYSLKGVHKNGL